MDAILTINTGSATVKFAVFSVAKGKLTREYSGTEESYYEDAIHKILDWINAKSFNIIAAGHRIVHGGPNYTKSVILNDKILNELSALTAIMPLHQPFNLAGVKILQQKLSNIVQVGCFDTMFHATCNPVSQHYPLPQRFTEDGIRRYGFHGLSYEYIASQLPRRSKFIVAHLGNGASMCAIKSRKSLATTMSFTALDGLPMGTRCGALDPGLVLYLMDKYKLNTEQMRHLFYKESGLLGMSGISSDMRELLASKKSAAKLAIEVFVHRVAIYAGLLAAELQGVDGFVFTGGIGEHATSIRKQISKKLAWLKIKSMLVIPTDEELMIAKHALNLL
jgi:acetate kinase